MANEQGAGPSNKPATARATDLGAPPHMAAKAAAPQAAPPSPPQRTPQRHAPRRKLSDEEVMRAFEAEEADQFYIDPDVIPAGLVYEWKRHEVYGKDDKAYEVDILRRGWEPVMAEDHPGYFMPSGYKGQVVRGGQGLYKMDAIDYENRQRYQQLLAKRAVNEQEQVLGLAPTNTFQRTKATITKNYEAVDVIE